MNFRVENGKLEVFGETAIFPLGGMAPSARCILPPDKTLALYAENLWQKSDKQPIPYIRQLQDSGFELAGVLEGGDAIYIFNDWFGRAPLYSWSAGPRLIVGDLLSEFSRLAGEPLRFDPDALRQYLWCTYPLRGRTLYKNVSVIDPNTIWKIDKRTGDLETLKGGGVLEYRLDSTDTKFALSDARDLFYDAFKRRIALYPQLVLSLSGGQDSRAMLAALENLNLNYGAATFYYNDGRANPDRETARLLMSIVSKLDRWAEVAVDYSAEQEDEMIRLRCGMNYLGVNPMVGYLDAVRKRFGADSVFLTGDGGDKVFPDLRDQGATSMDSLIGIVLKRHALMPVDQVEALIPKARPVAEMVGETLAAYPEQDLTAKTKAFVIRERARKCFFEGEQRNRQFFASTTAFYDPAFYRYMMRAPDELKSGYRLYRDFQNLISPQLASIRDAAGYSINSWKYELRNRAQTMLRVLPTRLKNRLRRFVGMGTGAIPPAKQQVLTDLTRQVGGCGYFNTDQLLRAIPELTTYQYWYWRTLLRLLQSGHVK